MALGITTATRNFSTGAVVAGAFAPHALKMSESAITNVKNHVNFFIFFSLLDGYDSFYGTVNSISIFIFSGLESSPPQTQFSLSKGFVNAAGARTLDAVTTSTKIVST
jgi:hypothetical protein